MNIPYRTWFALLSLLALSANLEARNLFILSGTSGTSATGTATVYNADSFTPFGSFTTSPAAFNVLTNANGNKYYVVARAGTDTVVVHDGANFTRLKSFNLGQGEAAAISPDGRRLVVAAGALFIIDAVNDNLIQTSADVGSNPIDVAISQDSSRAFVLSAQSNRLTAIDLASNLVTGPTLAIPGQSTGVAVAPNGLVYVTTLNRVYEVDGRAMTIRNEIAINARPGKLHFTASGRYGVAVNQTPVTGTCALIFDLANRTLSGTVPNFNVLMERVVIQGSDRAYLISSQTQKIYEVPLTNPNAIAEMPGALSGVLAATTTSEAPTPRLLYVTTNTNIARVDNQSVPQVVTGSLAIPANSANVIFAGPAATGVPSQLLQFNNNQSTAAGQTYLPLGIRALDATGRPLANVAVSYVASVGTATIQGANTTTNADGYAQATVVAPGTSGTFTVTATAGPSGAQVSATFTLSVGGGGAGGGTGSGIFIVGGNGQIVREQFLITEPFKVEVRDVDGRPVPGIQVTWTLAAGQGTMTSSTADGTTIEGTVCQGTTCTSITNSSGQALAGFLATAVLPGFSYQQQTITASTVDTTVNFICTTILSNIPGGGQASPPIVEVIKPALDSDRTITGKAGESVAEAIQVRVIVVSGPQSGQGIPNVGIRATTGLDPLVAPTAQCGNEALTNSVGVGSCDLKLGGKTGSASLQVNVGAFLNLNPLNLIVQPGAPGLVRVVQGNNQSGNPGQRLQLAFLAEISDNFGNLLPGTPVQWEIVTPNSITLSNVVSTSDSNSRVSALGTLGTIPGSHQVRVTAGTAAAVFNFSVNVVVSRLDKVSGDGQVAAVSTAFAQPLVVRVLDDKNAPIPGSSVDFTVISGSATLSSSRVSADSQGNASVNVTAGPQAGPVQVRASIASLQQTFNLTVRLPGPTLSAANVWNAASGQSGVVPCGLVTVAGAGIAPGIQNLIPAYQFFDGSLPVIWQGVEVFFEGTPSPILQVGKLDGMEQVTVQAPCSLVPGTQVSLTVRVSGGSTTISGVPILRVQPGIFESKLVPAGQPPYAVLHRADGTPVTTTSPASRGEILRMYVTGLGLVTPVTGTNKAGVAGQIVVANLIAGVDDEGTRITLAEYMPGMIGVYVVAFEVPATARAGQNISLQLAAEDVGGQYVFGRSVIAAVQ